MNKKYIHYGESRFNPADFCEIRNEDYPFVKPRRESGLWASPIDAKYGWKDWCEDNDFHTKELANWFTFTIADTARIYDLYSIDDLERLPKQKCKFEPSRMYYINFEEAAKLYDGIELHLTVQMPKTDAEDLYYRLYGWDCDCILILNPNVIQVIDSSEDRE